MTTDLARQQRTGGALATEAPHNPWSSAGLLKPYAGGEVHEAPKVDALATISAGYKNAEGYPVVSRDGTIYVRNADRAPGLVAELERRGNKSLTIALVHNDPKDVLQQWFATYSKTRLEARGNGDEITLIHLRDSGKRDNRNKAIMIPERETIRRDTDPERFKLLAADMKVQTSLYFALAEWDGAEPRLIFPDGLGLYRLHFTSLNSAEAIKSQLSYIASLTGGRVAGVPLELSIAYRNLAGPDGVRRDKVPVWSLVLQPPETIKLSPAVVASILQSGIDQAQQLAIAAPRMESLEYAEYEGADADLDEARIVDGQIISQRDVAQLAGGGPIRDAKQFEQIFFTSGGPRDDDDRRNFMVWATGGRYDSLKRFAASATYDEGRNLMEALAQWAKTVAEARQEAQERGEEVAPRPAAEKGTRSYEQLFGDDSEDAPPQPAAPQAKVAPTTSSPEVMAAFALTGAQPVQPVRVELPEDLDLQSGATKAQLISAYTAWASTLIKIEPSYQPRFDLGDLDRVPFGPLLDAVEKLIPHVKEVHAKLTADAEAEGE